MATVEKRGKGYRITVAAGIGLDGRQIRRRTIWTPNPKMTPRQVEKELARQVVKFEEQVKAGGGTDGGGEQHALLAGHLIGYHITALLGQELAGAGLVLGVLVSAWDEEVQRTEISVG